MDSELYRQFVHLSGLIFIILAQFIDKTIAGLYFIFISIFFLIYSEYIRREEKRLKILAKLEGKLRDIALTLERKTYRPFMGAFWFYFSLGIVFFLFPLSIASAAGAILAVGDSLSTIIGLNYGKHKIAGKKTLEGSIAFLIGSFIAAIFFVDYTTAVFAAVFATIIELIPAARPLKGLSERHIIDDNWMIPVFTAVFMILI